MQLVGRDEPRIRIVPPNIGTSGPEVVELAESTGVITLLPYQRLVLSDALGEQRSADDQRRWAAFEVAVWAVRQIGKGGILEARALGGMHLFGERRVVWSATRLKTVSDALERMKLYYESCDDLRKQVKRILTSHVDMAIELYGEGGNRLTRPRRIEFHTRTKHAARGLDGDCTFLDESYGCTRTFVGALVPIMGTRNDPQLWYTSTPPLDESVEEMRVDPETASGQVMYDLRARALAPDVHEVDELAYFDWGPDWWLEDIPRIEKERRKAGRPGIREDRQLWREHNPAIGRLQRIEQVAREARSMSARQFAREKLGAWAKPPPQEHREWVIPEAVWRACAEPAAAGDESMAPTLVAIAADAAPGRSGAEISLYGLRPDGVGQLEVVDRRAGVAWVPGRLAELRAAHDPLVVVVSSRGPLASVIDDIKAAGVPDPADREPGDRDPRRGDLLVTTLAEDAAATAQLIDACKLTAVRRGVAVADVFPDAVGDDLAHLDDDALTAQVEGAALRDLGDGAQVLGRRSSAVPIPGLYAGVLARWGFYQRRHLAEVRALTAQQIVDSIR